mgnify:CR=1 FL=1
MTVRSLLWTLLLIGGAWLFAACTTKKGVGKKNIRIKPVSIDENYRTFIAGEVAIHLPEYSFDDDELEERLN